MNGQPNNWKPATAQNRPATDREPKEQTATQPENDRRERRTATTPTPNRRAKDKTEPAGEAGEAGREGETEATGQTPKKLNDNRGTDPGYLSNAEGVKGGDGVWGVPR